MTVMINVEISELMRGRLLTGIQRVVRELAGRMIDFSAANPETYQIRLLEFDARGHRYHVVESGALAAMSLDAKAEVGYTGWVGLDEFGPNDIWFEVDSAWNPALKRASLYRLLKEQGTFIINVVYDFVPMLHPTLAHSLTVRNWTTYIAAVYAYSDLVIANSRSTERDFLDLAETFGVTRAVPTLVSKLGGDAAATEAPKPAELELIAPFSGKRYLLFVGTIEPRKHQLKALLAYERIMHDHPEVHLVFVGRQGWNSDDTASAIRHFETFGRRVHWLQGVSDQLLGELYRDAYLCLYLSTYEGFGLPVAEALTYGKVTITSGTSSIPEVGQELADYVQFNGVTELAETITLYLEREDLHRARREEIARSYHGYTWNEVFGTFNAILLNLDAMRARRALPAPTSLQHVFISNAPEKLARNIGLTDAHVPFVREYLVIAPAFQVAEIGAIDSIHPIRVIAEELILGDRLDEFRAADHQGKNWMLRSSLPTLDEVDEEFVMLDDDNLPLGPIGIDTYVNADGTRNGYYFYDLLEWPHHLSEYDKGQHETARVLDSLRLELLSYSSHQPQLISKSLYGEAVALIDTVAPGAAVDEWSVYFNYVSTRYPLLLRKKVFETLAWPRNASSWAHRYSPPRFTFENYYDESYDAADDGLFVDVDPADSDTKRSIKREELRPYVESDELFEQSRSVITALDLAHGTFALDTPDYTIYVSGFPYLITMRQHSTFELRYNYQMVAKNPTPARLDVAYASSELSMGRQIRGEDDGDAAYLHGVAQLPIVGDTAGVFRITFFATQDGVAYTPTGLKRQAVLVVLADGEQPDAAWATI